MALTAHLFARVIIDWEDSHHRERDLEVEVDYTFDGEALRITGTTYLGIPVGISDWDLEEAIWEAVNDQADEAYAEWLADYGEYLADVAVDRASEDRAAAIGTAHLSTLPADRAAQLRAEWNS